MFLQMLEDCRTALTKLLVLLGEDDGDFNISDGVIVDDDEDDYAARIHCEVEHVA